MTPAARIINDMFLERLTPEDEAAFSYLRRTIPGWSTPLHALFFKCVLKELFSRHENPALCICGVYHGLDLAIISDLAARYHVGRAYYLGGVDLFSSEPCDDWPAEKRGMTWEDAFGCAPPSMESAKKNAPGAEIIKARSTDYLAGSFFEAEFIYLDTSHDEKTVTDELAAIGEVDATHTILAGDDYTGPEGSFECGVKTALDKILPHHNAIANRLWIA
jgi:hypothetical protein